MGNPLTLIVAPNSFGSAPKRLRQVRSVSRATGDKLGLLLASVNRRPASGLTFSAASIPLVAEMATTRSDWPPTERTTLSSR